MNRNNVAALCTLAAISFTFSSSCMKVPNLEDNDGPTASAEAVQTSLLNSWGNAQPDSIKLNEFSYIEKNIALADSSSRLVLQEGKTVQKIDETSTDKTYTILQQTVEFSDTNQSKPSTEQRVVTVKKSADPVTNPLAVATQNILHTMDATVHMSSLPLSIETFFSLLMICKKDQNWDVSCHNLKTWESTEDAPQPIKDAGCRGLKDCKIRKKNVSFDLILNTVDPNSNTNIRQKIIYTAKITDDLPYLSKLSDFCIQGLMDFNTQKLPVTICQSVKDFRSGTP